MGMFSSPWQEASQGFSGIGNDINNIIVGLAQQKFQQEMARQQMAMRKMESDRDFGLKQQELKQQNELLQEHKKLYQAQASKAVSDAAQQQQEEQSRSAVGDALWSLGMRQAEQKQFGREMGTPSDLVTANLMQHLAGLPRNDSENIMKAALQAMASSGSPEMQRILAAGGANKLNTVVPVNATAFPGLPGMPVLQGMSTLNPGQLGFAPQTGLTLDQPREQVAQGLPSPVRPGMPNADLLQELSSLRPLVERKFDPAYIPVEGDQTMPMADVRFQQILEALTGQTNQSPQKAQQAVAQPKTKAEYDALPSGSVYIDTDGKTKRKK